MTKDKSILINNIYHMLSYAFQALNQETYEDVAVESFDEMYNLLAAILSKGIGLQLKQGLYREYISRQEELSVMRGEINMPGTIKNRLAHKRVLTCDFDELSENNLLNQILKTTVTLLLRNGKVQAKYKDDLKKKMLYFSNVEIIEPTGIKWSSIRFQRNNQTYRMLVSICQLIIEGMLITTDSGDYRLASFVDEQRMCRLYEKFILEYYSRHYPELSVSASQIPWSLDDGIGTMLPVMQSDIHLQRGNTVLIIDAKYYSHTTQSQFDKHTIHSNNLYQIFTYVKNRSYQFGEEKNTVSGMLLYAKTEELIQPDNVYQMHGNQITVRTLDLNLPFADIAKQLDDIAAFHHELSLQQLKCGFDYDPEFWGSGNYRLHADQIKCSALIVHGFNDENVSTKQFEMMHTAFEQAGQTVKLILHQGPHITPTMANKNYGILIDGKFYDDIVNEWISHYLYGVENSAEEMPEVLAQTNYDQKKWETESAWKTEHTIKLTSKEESKTVIDTDWEKAGVSAENFDDVMALKSTNMAQRYVTDPFEKAVTVQGTVCLNLKAALKDGNIETDFDPENRNDVDTLTMQLGNSKVSGKMDDVEIAVLLCDVCDEEFDSIQTVDPERNIVPVTTVKEGGIMNGGDLPAFDEAEFNTVHKKYRVITRAFADLCNPEAGYAPETAQNSIELKKGEYHDYTVYLNATRYTVEPGHRLAVVVATEDPVNCLIHKTYSVEIDDNSVMVEVPVTKASEDMGLNKAE